MNSFLQFRIGFAGLVAASGLLVAVGTVAGFFGRYAWWMDLASHFRVQYFAASVALCAADLLMRRRRYAVLWVALAAANAATIAPLYARGRQAPDDGGPVLRAMLCNVHTANTNAGLVVAAVRKEMPDLMVFEEIDNRWLRDLRALTNRYPYCIASPRGDNFGIALFSRLPLAGAEVLYIGGEVPSVRATVEFRGHRVTFVGTHPLPPAIPVCAAARDQQMRAMADYLRSVRGPLVLLGDLNMTPWSAHFREFVRATGFSDSERGWGVQPSWPSQLWFMRIPIDHCLHREGVRIVNRRIGDRVGSDHYPLIVDLSLAGPPGDSGTR
jgi:endonuclease/exonuclease/phosphatase (EEP) superfamily protein YafD